MPYTRQPNTVEECDEMIAVLKEAISKVRSNSKSAYDLIERLERVQQIKYQIKTMEVLRCSNYS